ncbi:DUF1932 domain-containing protein [Streptomyces sp. NBC_01619]|uniref:DUF1932 domain-containing protein n=1 Tax=Streptomyces sp. NBC_01619 TaxID=2975901 RepID=UPI0022550F9F|nr:NAD(P)-dependent oxidoreductase [Streptomyces sp. NBC_01619]MCX4513279.1 DUF1932 domain-containing protein [Streptomyces sp. NBC_01619]
MTTLGILHPGSMGAAVAAQARRQGAEVLWCPEGRSEASQNRALRYGLTAASNLAELCGQCDVIISLCPPANAVEVAASVAAESFTGTYVDANAISPGHMTQIVDIIGPTAAAVVDGSVIGSPPSESKQPRLYLSGPEAESTAVAQLFHGSAVRPLFLEGGIGKASALKLAYSSYQKAGRVLAAVSYALASDHGVEEELLDIARGRTSSYLTETGYFPKTAARAWRWAPEMREVASALDDAQLPAALMEASAEVLERWAALKDQPLNLRDALEGLHSASDG